MFESPWLKGTTAFASRLVQPVEDIDVKTDNQALCLTMVLCMFIFWSKFHQYCLKLIWEIKHCSVTRKHLEMIEIATGSLPASKNNDEAGSVLAACSSFIGRTSSSEGESWSDTGSWSLFLVACRPNTKLWVNVTSVQLISDSKVWIKSLGLTKSFLQFLLSERFLPRKSCCF